MVPSLSLESVASTEIFRSFAVDVNFASGATLGGGAVTVIGLTSSAFPPRSSVTVNLTL